MSDEPVRLFTVNSTLFRKINDDVEHRIGGVRLPTPARLDLAEYANVGGVYVFRYDYNGNELTDTYHRTVEEAMSQCEFEFGVQQGDWTAL